MQHVMHIMIEFAYHLHYHVVIMKFFSGNGSYKHLSGEVSGIDPSHIQN